MGLRELPARFARAFNCLTFSAVFICRSENEGQVDRTCVARFSRPGELGMRKFGIALALAASVAASGCVQSRQYADVQFTPPQGDYRLLVMRPDVTVNSLTTGGMSEPRADWTEQARGNIINALRTEAGGPGRQGPDSAKRNELPNVSAEEIADLERLHYAVGNSIALHKYSGASLPTKRGRGLEYTLGEDAVSLGRRTGYDYALFLYAQDNIASTGRTALQVLGVAGCFIGFCAPSGGSNQFAYASLVDLRSGEVVWFNVLQTGSQLPGIKFGDIRTQVAHRRWSSARRPNEARPRGPPGDGEALMCMRCAELSGRLLLAGGGALAASMATGIAQARTRPADMVPLIGPGFRPTDADEKGLWQQMDRVEEEVSGSNLLIKDPELVFLFAGNHRPRRRSRGEGHADLSGDIPDFNAVMFPTGFSVVFSGLLLRMRNEAQLAGVIAHESGHFLRRHMIRSWRDTSARATCSPSGRWSRASPGRGLVYTSATMSSWRNSARSSPCPSTAGRWKPRRTRWARSWSPRPAIRRSRWRTSGSN